MRPIAFVEDKHPQLVEVAEYLGESASVNRWTNFGPVWQRLKDDIEATLELPSGRCAIPCASGTHALMAAAALVARDGCKRWVVSSFGFRATVIGPFAGAEIVDCDLAGRIDLGKVEALGLSRRHGIVATNPFGIHADMTATIGVARRYGAALIVDNAAAYVGFDRSDHAGVFECLSFHHTKPFGFGEGGCLILDRTLEEDAKAAMDFGYRWNWSGGQDALSNGKLSDPAAALILARHLDSRRWMPAYREQFRRIADIGERAGYRLLDARERIGDGAHGNVPLLSPVPIALESLANDTLTLLKYYKPLARCPVSQDLFGRIVNVPCHPGVAAIDNQEMAALLEAILERGLST